jgi:ribosomal protein S18 acetylase RimI-like enzyme
MGGERSEVRRLAPDELAGALPGFAEVLADCVAGGASVNFMAGFTREDALAFWRESARESERDGRAFFAARDGFGIAGVVVLVPIAIPNQPHRAEITKLLVHRRARGSGLGEALMRAAEREARELGRTLLTLDTASDAALRLYLRLGFAIAGRIPGFALLPDGAPCDTTVMYKNLNADLRRGQTPS